MVSASNIKKLRQLADKNQLEVEHLLSLARVGDSNIVSLLSDMKRKHQWFYSGIDEGGAQVVPLARWADVVCEFLDGGYQRMVALATKELPGTTNLSFCAAVLETLKTSQSVAALSKISHALTPLTNDNLTAAVIVAEKFNLILSFNDSPPIDLELENDVRLFLHECLKCELTEAQRYTVVCALRGVGDNQSIDRIKTLPCFKYPYEGVEAQATRSIRNRLKQRATNA